MRSLIAIGVALALADASVVALALPPMLDDLDTSVEGVAAVIGVYTLVLAALLPVAACCAARSPTRRWARPASAFSRSPERSAPFRTTSLRCWFSVPCKRRAQQRHW